MIVRRLMVVLLAGSAALAATACDDDEGPQVERFAATLTGASEVPPVTTTATGTALIEFTTTGIQYTVNVNGIANVTNGGAHIHGPAAVGVNAGVILGLNPNTSITTGVLATGTATTTNNISIDSLKALIRSGLTYVNVHNTANPGGHIRGQLVRQ